MKKITPAQSQNDEIIQDDRFRNAVPSSDPEHLLLLYLDTATSAKNTKESETLKMNTAARFFLSMAEPNIYIQVNIKVTVPQVRRSTISTPMLN